MPSFGDKSKRILSTCDPRLQELAELVVESYDITVLEGFRTNARQDELFRQGKSKLQAGESKHNQDPSLAIDIAPYPIDWENPKRFYLLAGFMFQAAAGLGINLRWGGDWDRDWIHTDQTFHDLPHFEIVE
jgi:peptidoglycan L-alanyl-D-glutamate endopeptidase CwlK